jgi:hypothetical protein
VRKLHSWCVLLISLAASLSASSPCTAELSPGSSSTIYREIAHFRVQSPYQSQDSWYDFILKQFNPHDVDYGKWAEQHRREFIDLCLKNPYFLYSFWTTIALLVASSICVKQGIDHRKKMWMTAEMMADLYNQDAYSRQVAQEAIERYNKHIERCNRAIEGNDAPASAGEMEQLRTELMRVAEQRDMAIRDRDIAREDLRRKSEILADMSVRLDAATNKGTSPGSAKAACDPRTSDTRLVSHINNLQEQLYAERTNNRRLKGG